MPNVKCHGPLSNFSLRLAVKFVCLVCNKHGYIQRLFFHSGTNHAEKYTNLSEDERVSTAGGLVAKIQKYQGLQTTKFHTTKEGNIKTSYVLAHKFAKRSKPCSDGEFIKGSLVNSVALFCPEKTESFQHLSLSRGRLQGGLRTLQEVWSYS